MLLLMLLLRLLLVPSYRCRGLVVLMPIIPAPFPIASEHQLGHDRIVVMLLREKQLVQDSNSALLTLP